MTKNEAVANSGRQIECPVEWCRGDWYQHGGEGQHPEDWVHDDGEGFELPHGARLSRDQEGTRPVSWRLQMQWEGSTFAVGQHTDPEQLASFLRAIAAEIDSVAARHT